MCTDWISEGGIFVDQFGKVDLQMRCLNPLVWFLPMVTALPFESVDTNDAMEMLQTKASKKRSSTGTVLDLEYSTYRLLLHVRIGSLPAHKLLLDTGSSTVAFCNMTLPSTLPGANQTQFKACEQYGPSGPNGYFKDGYVGPFFSGSLRLKALQSELEISKALFAVFAEGSCSPQMCLDQPSQGIFGIAYRQRNKVYPHDEDLSSMCVKKSSTDLQILCPSTKASLLPPLMQELRLTSDGSELLGIYWSGAASGNLFLGPAAVETPYYEGENGPQTAYLLDASPGASGWYNVNVLKIKIGDIEYQGFDCIKHARACIVDTGTPVILLPYELSDSMEALGQTASSKMKVHLAGVSGDVVLDFDLDQLLSTGLVGIVNPPKAFWDPLMVLGLPIWAHYYTMFNLTADTVSFTYHS